MKLLKKLVIVLAFATLAAVALSVVAPDLLSKRDIESFLQSPTQGLQDIAEKGTSKAGQLAGKAAEKAKQETVNTLVDQSGLKEAAAAELHARAGEIAWATGMDEATVDYVIDLMDIPSWQATTLPEGKVAQAHVPLVYEGSSATVVTYDDPAYMTVEAYGQAVTFAVPSQAQDYIPYLSYLSN